MYVHNETLVTRIPQLLNDTNVTEKTNNMGHTNSYFL